MTKRTSAANAAALPADSPNRRTLLTSGAAAALIASSAPVALAALAPADIDPDAALLALRGDYDRTREAWALSWPAHTAAEERYFELRHDGHGHSEDELQRLSGLAAVTPEYEQLENANHDALCAMVEMPARTLRGVIAKAEVSAIEDNMNPELVASLVADLVAMKPRAA